MLKDLTDDLQRFDIIKETTINVDRLDNLLSGIGDVQMLQIDVPGASYEVILGAQKILQNVKYVTCEARHVSLYSGEKLSDDIISIMEKMVLSYQKLIGLFIGLDQAVQFFQI